MFLTYKVVWSCVESVYYFGCRPPSVTDAGIVPLPFNSPEEFVLFFIGVIAVNLELYVDTRHSFALGGYEDVRYSLFDALPYKPSRCLFVSPPAIGCVIVQFQLRDP